MDELKKLFEAVAKEKTRNQQLQKEEILKEVEKSQKKKTHSKKVQEDFWAVFKSELNKLSEVEEVQEQAVPDFFADIDPQKMASEFDIRPVSQITENDMSTQQSVPYELKDHPTTLVEMPDKTGILDPDISSLEAKVNKLELKYAGLVDEEPEPKPEPVKESKDAFNTVMDLSLIHI